jgi:hypothetical protein
MNTVGHPEKQRIDYIVILIPVMYWIILILEVLWRKLSKTSNEIIVAFTLSIPSFDPSL